MAVWKKVITSGSNAQLNALYVQTSVTASVVSASFTGSLFGTASAASFATTASYVTSSNVYGPYASNSILSASHAVTAAYALAAAAQNALTNGEGITAFSYNGGTAGITVSISGAIDLTEGRHIRWDNTANKVANSLVYDDGTNVQITGSSIIVSGASTALIVTGSVRSLGGFTGSLFGTASYVTGSIYVAGNLATSASFAVTASYANYITGSGTVNRQSKFTAGNTIGDSLIYDDGTNLQITGSSIIVSGASTALIVTGSVRSLGGFTGSLFGTASYVTGSIYTAGNLATSASFAITASYATNGGTLVNSLSAGTGLSGSSFNGSAASSFHISGAAQLTTNLIPKWTGTGLNNSNITDTGTQIQIGAGASSGVNVAAGGISVTGNSTFANNVRISGNLNVEGTASFENTQNLLIGDRFAALASGSQTLTDGGIIVVSSTSAAGAMSGSAWYLETGTGPGTSGTTNFGLYGRWASAFNVSVTASNAVTSSEYAVTVNVAASSDPSAAPVWGGSDNGSGNMWINNTTGDIFIYA